MKKGIIATFQIKEYCKNKMGIHVIMLMNVCPISVRKIYVESIVKDVNMKIRIAYLLAQD